MNGDTSPENLLIFCFILLRYRFHNLRTNFVVKMFAQIGICVKYGGETGNLRE